MIVKFLGTGTSQGVPVIACNCDVCTSDDPKDNRTRSSVLVTSDDVTLVIDTGPDFRQQMLREKVTRLDAVLLTHGHKDHIGGLDDVRAFNYVTKMPVDIYASRDTQSDIRRDFYYAFDDNKYPGIPKLKLYTIDNLPFNIKDLEIIPVQVLHYYLKILAFRIRDFTYITDCNHIPDGEIKKIEGSRVIVVNALRMKKHISHYNLEQALELIDCLKPEKAFITHISHQMGRHHEVSPDLPANVYLAYDGLELKIES